MKHSQLGLSALGDINDLLAEEIPLVEFNYTKHMRRVKFEYSSHPCEGSRQRTDGFSEYTFMALTLHTVIACHLI